MERSSDKLDGDREGRGNKPPAPAEAPMLVLDGSASERRKDCTMKNERQICADKALSKANALASLLDEDRCEKAVFTSIFYPVLKAIDGAIVSAEYQASDVREYECVTIEYRNGRQKRANVTGDSLKALAIDVLETL